MFRNKTILVEYVNEILSKLFRRFLNLHSTLPLEQINKLKVIIKKIVLDILKDFVIFK